MQLWRQEFELDGINSGTWYPGLPIWIVRGRLYRNCERSSRLHRSETFACKKKKMRWHLSGQR